MRKTVRLLAVTGAAVLLAPAVAACSSDSGSGSGGSGGSADGMIQVLNGGAFGGGASPQKNYNPFSPNRLITDYTFEPLFITDSYNCKPNPWLAKAYKWETTSKLTFTLRPDAKWHDGKPFTAKDVAFTFNMLKKFPALDLKGAWQSLKSVTAEGTGKVVFDFNGPSVPMFGEVAGTVIVPEHIWSKVKDPVKFTNPTGIGTGPFKMKSFNGQRLMLERDAKNWQADKVKVKQLQFDRAPKGSQVGQLKLARGDYDYNSMFVPDIDKVYASKNKDNKYWFPPGGNISLYMNLTKKPFDDVKFRRALTTAIDRKRIIDKAQYGYVKQASQTAVSANRKDWLDPSAPDGGKIAFDLKAAQKALAGAGYKKKGGKLLGKNGKPLVMKIQVPTGWTDWIQAMNIVKGNLEKLGIQVNSSTPDPQIFTEDLQNARFDLAFGVHGGDCNMYKGFNFPLGSKNTAPVGKPAPVGGNSIRWKDPKTDKLLDEMLKAKDEAGQKKAALGLQKIMTDQVPMIPMWAGGRWFQYRTEKAVGWPDAKNPYAGPINASNPDGLIVMTRLRPAG